MRVIAGLAKGMSLAVPRRGVRPTADRIREAIFSSLGARARDGRVLDLFAGTGALGVEAASRGAVSVTFVENARGALECLEQNAGELINRFRGGNPAATPPSLEIARDDVPTALKRMALDRRRFSLIFADPPYGGAAQELMRDERLPLLMTSEGLFVLESAQRDVLTVIEPWELVREAVYGDTRVSFLRTKR